MKRTFFFGVVVAALAFAVSPAVAADINFKSTFLQNGFESLTKDFGVSILISKEIFSRLEDPDIYKYRFLGNTNVKGNFESVAIFEIYDADPTDILDQKDMTKREFENAVYYFGIEDYSAAEVHFKNVLVHFPGDKASSLYLEQCRDKMVEITNG